MLLTNFETVKNPHTVLQQLITMQLIKYSAPQNPDIGSSVSGWRSTQWPGGIYASPMQMFHK